MHDGMNDGTAELLLAIMAKYTTASDIRPDSRLQGDLGIDSFDMVNIAIEVQEKYGVAFLGKKPPPLGIVSDVIEYVRKLRSERK